MRSEHYAIVIGLSSYEKLGDPPPQNLQGAENDADDIYDWLTDPNRGGLPTANVRRIRSKDWQSPPPGPTRDRIAEEFLWLDQLAGQNRAAGKGRTVGTRFYLYASGHGFSPRPKQGCLLAGNAAERQFGANVFPTAWIEWLQEADYFRECVLWMDCCMDRVVMTPPTPPPLDPIYARNSPGPSFVAFAASRPLKAVEKPIPEDGGRWHGIFTWNLLQGLRGAAANEFGIVTGKSLGDWLRHAQLSWLDDAEQANPDIAKEPAIIADDENLVFARGLDPLRLSVTLRTPQTANGKVGRVWFGRPPRPRLDFQASSAGTPVTLPPGLYVAEVPSEGLRQGFAVTRAGDVSVSESGDAPSAEPGNDSGANRSFNLSVEANDPTASIHIIGDGFRSVDAGLATLTSKLPLGLYEMRIQIGRQLARKVVLLDGDWPKAAQAPTAANEVPALPMFTSAAPLPGTRATHEYHRVAARQAGTRFDSEPGIGGELMIMARGFSASGNAAPDARPWDGVAILDSSGQQVADLDTIGQRQSGGDPWATASVRVSPDAYVLQYALASGATVNQSLVLPHGGWRLEGYVLQTLDAQIERPRVSLLMRRAGDQWGTHEDLLFEKVRVALADERPILSRELEDLLLLKFRNPLAGILGAHLLLMEQELGRRDRGGLLNTVVTNLRALVGKTHPDVEALSLACSDPTLRSTEPFAAVPMFERSWRLILNASRDKPALIPSELWQRVFALVSSPPFLVWSPDAAVRKTVGRDIALAAFATEPEKPAPMPAGLESFDASVAAALPPPPSAGGRTLRGVSATRRTAQSAGLPRARSRKKAATIMPHATNTANPPRLRPGVAESLGLPPLAAAVLWKDYLDKP
jgi:hypothetical protein